METNLEEYFLLNPEIILRAEPQYYNSFFAYNPLIQKTMLFTKGEYEVLETIRNESKTKEEISLEVFKSSNLKSIERVGKFLQKVREKGIVIKYDKRVFNGEKTGVDYHFDQIQKYPVPILSGPSEVDICLTLKCNLRCVHCNVNAGKSLKGELSAKLWKKVLDQLEDMKVLKVTVAGGEPFTYPEFNEFLEYLGEKKFLKVILTNSTLIDKNMVNKLSEYKISLSTSVDGSNPGTHDVFRGKADAFKHLMDALDLMKERELVVNATTVINKLNIHQFHEIVKLCVDKKIKKITFVLLDPIGRGAHADKLALSHTEIINTFSSLKELEEEFRGIIEVNFENPLTFISDEEIKKKHVFCKAGTYGMAIYADGTVYPCNQGYQLRKFRMGNVRNSALIDIWLDEKWNKFRGAVKIEDLKICRKCGLKYRCSLNSCRMKSLIMGDFYGKPLRCPLPYIKNGSV